MADGEAAGTTGDDGGAGRATAAGRDALGAAALWPPSATASVIATPAATGTPVKTAAPDRKLISSMRAFIVLLSRSKPWSPLPDLARYRGIGRLGGTSVARQYALDESSIDDLTLNFTLLPAERVIDENPTDLAQYGLAPPRAQGEAVYSDGTTKTLLLGDKTPSGSTYYMQVKGDPKVYTVWQNHGDQMHWTLADLRDKKITPALNYDEVTYFNLTRSDGTVIELQRKTAKENKVYQLGFSTFLMTRPYSYPRGVDSEKQDQLIKGPQQVQISSFVSDDPKDLSRYGLARPSAEVVVRDKTSSLDLLFGSADRYGQEVFHDPGEAECVHDGSVEPRLPEDQPLGHRGQVRLHPQHR